MAGLPTDVPREVSSPYALFKGWQVKQRFAWSRALLFNKCGVCAKRRIVT